MSEWLTIGDDRSARCKWGAGADVQYREYHDNEWGHPVTDDRRLFEKLCLEGFQSGLSWLTILRKRENFRTAFANFDAQKIALFDERDVERMLADAGIVRHRGKIESTINNARRALLLVEEFGSLARYVWGFENAEPHRPVDGPSPIPSTSPASVAMSKDMKQRGWSFVGPTTVYAFMQAMGLTNDHMDGCFVRQSCLDERVALRASWSPND